MLFSSFFFHMCCSVFHASSMKQVLMPLFFFFRPFLLGPLCTGPPLRINSNFTKGNPHRHDDVQEEDLLFGINLKLVHTLCRCFNLLYLTKVTFSSKNPFIALGKVSYSCDVSNFRRL